MLKLNLMRTGYLLGLSLLLAAVVYFFAANWAGLDRLQKVGLSIGIVIFFYGISLLFARFRILLSQHSYLSNVFLVGGCITFGISVALIGQIYNSHADSYSLFLIWSVAALVLAFITRYTPFYILSFVTAHLTLWLYFFPTSMAIQHDEERLVVIYAIFAIINIILFSLTEFGRLRSATIRLFSFLTGHLALLALSNSLILPTYGVWLNVLSIAAIGFGFYYFYRSHQNLIYLTLNALVASAFAVLKFIELAEEFASVGFFIYGLIFVALLLTGNVLFFRFLNRIRTAQSEEGKEDNEKLGTIIGKIVSTIVIIIGVVIGSVSLSGMVIAATLDVSPEYTLFFLSMLFVLPMILLPKLNSVIRYTVLTIGYISGIVSIIWIDELFISVIYLVISFAAWFRLEGRLQRFVTYALMNINMAIVAHQIFDTYNIQAWTYVMIILAVMNGIVYFIHQAIREDSLKHQLRDSGLYFSLFYLFLLTFAEDIFPYSYALFNLLNFALVTFLVFVFVRRSHALDAAISLIFWFMFLVYKYYDLLWTLLHKSITLAILGCVVLIVTYMLARYYDAEEEAEISHSVFGKSLLLILIAILLQIGFLGYQTAQSEHLLTTGTLVKLELQPLDPRSMLQGDYLVLNYEISTPPDFVSDKEDNKVYQKKVKVVLAPDNKGVYEYQRLYQPGDKLGPDEVLISGSRNWDRIDYGIEHYFIPEGTGRKFEQKARFAYVRVGANGDALLERIDEK